jgi:hypothetical protein
MEKIQRGRASHEAILCFNSRLKTGTVQSPTERDTEPRETPWVMPEKD